MPTAPDALYDRLQDPAEVARLFNTAEDTVLDCKQWLGDEKGKRTMIAKAVSGFANGDGGVIAVGLVADSHGKDDPDVIKGPAYVQAPHEVKAKVLSFLQSDVEPLIQGLRVDVVPMEPSGTGVVLVLVPSQDGLPVRSKRDWQFYLRSGSSTQNMPLTVLADRFGRRPLARLVVSLGQQQIDSVPTADLINVRARVLPIYIENRGRGVARFPALMLAKDCGFLPWRHPYAQAPEGLWAYSESEENWRSWRGGSEAVVYPGEKLKMCRVVQFPRPGDGGTTRFFDSTVLRLGTVCEGAPVEQFSFSLSETTTTF